MEATTQALKEQYPDRKLTACLELHTFSSLNKSFLSQYQDTLNYVDIPIVYYNPLNLVHKKLEPINENDILQAFGVENLKVFNDIDRVENYLKKLEWKNNNLLMMSSGNFDGLNMNNLANHIIKNI